MSTATAAGGVVPFAIAQEEEASLGEEDDLADRIVSDVLDDQSIVDQDNTAEQDIANVGLQDQDTTQKEDQVQDAANTNVDLDILEGEQSPLTEPPTPRPPDDGGQPPPGGEPPLEEIGKIAFQSQRGAQPGTLAQIYIMNADGSEQTRLT